MVEYFHFYMVTGGQRIINHRLSTLTIYVAPVMCVFKTHNWLAGNNLDRVPAHRHDPSLVPSLCNSLIPSLCRLLIASFPAYVGLPPLTIYVAQVTCTFKTHNWLVGNRLDRVPALHIHIVVFLALFPPRQSV